jgi:hypothetical protein
MVLPPLINSFSDLFLEEYTHHSQTARELQLYHKTWFNQRGKFNGQLDPRQMLSFAKKVSEGRKVVGVARGTEYIISGNR